jgi:6-phosphogluconolactonase/glucosamine-6-phosphate isomerase/deaminase
VAFLVAGKAKASVVRDILEGKNQILPASRVHPERGRTLWFLDRDAASLLKNRNI